MACCDDIDQILGPGGAVAANHPFYEHRPGQIKMAQAVADAIGQNWPITSRNSAARTTLAQKSKAIRRAEQEKEQVGPGLSLET